MTEAQNGKRRLLQRQDGSGPSLSSDLWVSDGTAAGTFAVGGAGSAGIAGTERAGLDPTSITPLGAGVLFNGINSQFRGGVWFSNGTAAGTYEIGGLNSSGVAGVPSGGLFASDITVFGDKALFLNQNVNDTNGLWVTDGTAAGTFELGGPENSGIAGRHFSGLVPEDLTSARNKVFFVATDTDDFRGLWVTDGTTSGTVEVGGLNNAGISGAPASEFDPSSMESFGNGVIFSFGNSLWVSDGTASGTTNIANVGADNLFVFGTKVLFDAASGLWISDGTAAGTTEIGGSANAGSLARYTGCGFPLISQPSGTKSYSPRAIPLAEPARFGSPTELRPERRRSAGSRTRVFLARGTTGCFPAILCRSGPRFFLMAMTQAG
jgi:ELWxxDGT repeat protein